MAIRIPVYRPYLAGNETAYVTDCMNSTWISSRGEYIDRFEKGMRELTGAKHAIAVFNGSVALHLALECLGIGEGDEVIVPTFTYIASVNAIAMTGAKPVFVESLKDTWLMDPEDVRAKLTPRTRAIMPVHLYGISCDMTALSAIAHEHDLKIVEDAAEAIGTRTKGQHVGHECDAATFSFFGNKTITCGEGGMVITNDDALAENMRITKNHGMSTTKRYWHDRFGVNYRMTNLQAAIGTAQLEQLNTIMSRKAEIYRRYRDGLSAHAVDWQTFPDAEFESNHWLVSFLAPSPEARTRVEKTLDVQGIETRPLFHCAHVMPPYHDASARFPVAEDISARGMSLPSFPDLRDEEIDEIVQIVKGALQDGS